MLTVYDQNQNELGVLDNAYNVSIERRANEIYHSSFSLPLDDDKNALCSHFNYIDIYGESGRYYGKHRIMPTKTKKHDNTVSYECEHVLATLWDDLMDDYVQFENQSTQTVLEGILSFQETQHWVLGQCDFEYYIDYAYENEDGLVNALFDVPSLFGEDYQFTFDTTSYPWTLNLIKPSSQVKGELRWGKNIKKFEDISDPSEIVNFIIPKGWGEGVNQLTIKDANNGVRYLQDSDSIQKWGKIKRRLIDRRFKDPYSLMKYGEKVLNEHKDPLISFKCEAVDLSILPEFEHERVFLGDQIQIKADDTYYARIIGEKIQDLSKEYDVDYELGNRTTDITDHEAELDRDMNVSKGYTNGSANYLSANETENADPSHPVKFRIWIPQDVVHFNFMELTYESSAFRAYVKGTKSAGQVVKSSTTDSGGESVQSSTTSSGGDSVQSETTTSTASHRHTMFYAGGSEDEPPDFPHYRYYAKVGGMDTAVSLPAAGGPTLETYSADGAHSHGVTVNIPSHSHDFSVNIPSHSHDFSINIPGHAHDQEFGIYEHNSMPTSLEITVDGTVIPNNQLSDENVDLVPYLQKDSNGRISRGRWAEVELRPTDELVRINATVVWGLFISSLKGTAL